MLRPLSFYKKASGSVDELMGNPKIKSRRVPDAIVNWIGPNREVKQQQSQAFKTGVLTESNFFITVNANLGYRRFNQQGRVNLAEHFDEVMREFGQLLESKEMLQCATIRGNYYDCKNATVKQYDYSLEIGQQKGNVHSHAVLMLNGVAQIDEKKARKFFADKFSEYHTESTGNIHLDIIPFRSNEAVLKAYMSKAQNSLRTAIASA
jgi:hypothetical protein